MTVSFENAQQVLATVDEAIASQPVGSPAWSRMTQLRSPVVAALSIAVDESAPARARNAALESFSRLVSMVLRTH